MAMMMKKAMAKKSMVKKAQKGKTQKMTPTYKNLRMGVANEYYEATGQNKDIMPTGLDSNNYRRGFERGLKGEKGYPNERNVEKVGRWEGQNAAKKATKPKNKNGGTLSPSKKSVGKTIGKLNKAKSGMKMSKKK
jgi:hypothetical protein